MKKTMVIGLFGLMVSISSCAQEAEMENVKKTIKAFASAGDFNDANELEKCLDDNYRIVMNRLFGSNEVTIMTKSLYLEKIRSKEFGGDSREVTFNNVIINGNTASAQVTLKGNKMTLVSLITLVKEGDDNWKLISDMPIVSN